MPRTRPRSTPQYELARQLSAAELAFKQSLVQLRKDADLTQDAVAKRMGVDKSAVSRFERIDSNPRLATIRAYALAINAMVEMNAEIFEPEVYRHSDTSSRSSAASWVGAFVFLEDAPTVTIGTHFQIDSLPVSEVIESAGAVSITRGYANA